jgi:Methyltransferase domain
VPCAPPPAWVQGGCSLGDLQFLAELVAHEQPTTVVEIGVAAGTSSAALLAALDQLPGPRVLYSIDVRPTCYFDPQRKTGAAVAEMYPTPRAQWGRAFGSDARHAANVGHRFDLAFIDANHHHPYPLLDVVRLAGVLKPGAWIALHDLELPRLYPQWQSHGPMWLFELWPDAKVHGQGDAENIGAVRLPEDLRELLAPFKALLARPWEQTPTLAEINPLPGVFTALEGTVLARRRRARPVGARRA